ncbi:MAG TPA: metalloregulator ArsR/SmtB family transcription factor [Ktedonobacterales bacterium]|nr:metalloregulator ArsR/SmtB family transcription factor [Ktedonobacterales bacterium]
MSIARRLPTVTPQDMAAVGAALADPTRVQMLRLMEANEEVACAALEATFSLTKSTISYHVRVLRHAGLIRVRKAGKFYYYALVRDEIERRFPGLLMLLGATDLPDMAGAETAADCQ